MITSPATTIPPYVSINTAKQTLPFEALSWENFEKLCYRLAGKDANIEFHSLYGRQGQSQQGIDIFARKRNGKYNSWQSKKYKKYTTTDLDRACKKFLAGEWASKSDNFVIAIQCSVDDVILQDKIEDQAKQFMAQGITLAVLGGTNLSNSLRAHPDIVLEFFGRDCARDFYGDTIDDASLAKLDGAEFQKVRAQLRKVYQTGFDLLDITQINANTPFSDQKLKPLSLLKRFTHPDVLIKENSVSFKVLDQTGNNAKATERPTSEDQRLASNWNEVRQTEQYRRSPIAEWLTTSDQIAVIGNAGSGKSTVLRCLALDLLCDQNLFIDFAKKWGRHLPIFISFAKWVRLTESSPSVISIKELVRSTWQQQLTSDLVSLIDKAIDEYRVILFVDGLDEWANEQAARTTLQSLLTIVAAHSIPVIVSARPGGLSKIGRIPDNWNLGMLAPLSQNQQRNIATMWFARNSSKDPEDSATDEFVHWQTNRFFNELRKGRGLATLAETPLLLLGLIALAVRQLVLPINKVQALSQLTELLLELHPTSRATAAGDTNSRFSSAATIDVRREALAALAFTIRTEGGDAGFPLAAAQKCIKAFLIDPDGFSYSHREAIDVANEILAVNSESIGLLVEKGPKEVGFVHASIEEYLASVHIHSWPLEKIIDFVKYNASNFRWRSVFSDLIARNERRSEAEKIVIAIDEKDEDAIGAYQRKLLLADVVFNGAEITRPTALKIAERSLDIIAGSGWENEKRTHLNAALEGLFNLPLRENTSKNICRWAIRRNEYLYDFYQAVSKWDRSACQLTLLKIGFRDENFKNARAAAHGIAHTHSGNSEVEAWLTQFLQGSNELQVAGLALEALVLGWPENVALNEVLNESKLISHNGCSFSLIWAKIKKNMHSDADLSALLQRISWYTGLNYEHWDIVIECLIEGWKDNRLLTERSILSLSDNFNRSDIIEKEVALRYLTQCSPKNKSVDDWILKELDDQHPFTLSMREDLGWLLPFCASNSRIKEKVISYLTSQKIAFREHSAQTLYINIKDERILNYLLSKVRTENGVSIFWSLAPLLQGWAAKRPETLKLIEEILSWPIEKKCHIANLFPLMLDEESCLSQIENILIAENLKNTRYDTLVSALSQIKKPLNTRLKKDLIERVLGQSGSPFSGTGGLIALYPEEPILRKHAFDLVSREYAPLAALATIYKDDPEFHDLFERVTGSLNLTLRQQIIDSAASEYDRNDTAKAILKDYGQEKDNSLKIHSSIKYHQAKCPADLDKELTIENLLMDAQAPGIDRDARVAAAFAGLIAYNASDRFADLKWADRPVEIPLGSYGGESQALLRLMAERWDDLSVSFGNDPTSRLSEFSSRSDFWSLISPYISANSSLRKDFLAYCGTAKGFLETPQLQALGKELPRSDLLLDHCLKATTISAGHQRDWTWPRYQSYFEAAYILKEHFGDDSSVLKHLETTVLKNNHKYGVAALAIYNPFSHCLDDIVKELMDRKTDISGIHAVSIILASKRLPTIEFGILVKQMVNRDSHNIWDFQARTNSAIQSRLETDNEFVDLLTCNSTSDTTESEIASYARYLAGVGKIDAIAQGRFQSILNEKITHIGIPPHGYDAISDIIRPTAHSLLDALIGSVN